MPTEEPEAAPVKLSELVDAFEFVSVSDLDEHQAYTLDKWHAFEARATELALEEWCVEVGVTLIDNEQPA